MSKSSSDLLNISKCKIIYQNDSKKSLEYIKGEILTKKNSLEILDNIYKTDTIDKIISTDKLDNINKIYNTVLIEEKSIKNPIDLNSKYSTEITKNTFDKAMEFWNK